MTASSEEDPGKACTHQLVFGLETLAPPSKPCHNQVINPAK